jgi:hypothetical protein
VRRIGVAVVEQLNSPHALRFVGQIGRAMGRQHLLVDPSGVHQFEPTLDIVDRI